MMNPAIRLSPSDNVAVCCRAIEAGELLSIDGIAIVATEPIDLGHKIALAPLAVGAKIVKYGMPIGSVTIAVPQGGWLHIHNMQSDYISVHLRDTAGDHA